MWIIAKEAKMKHKYKDKYKYLKPSVFLKIFCFLFGKTMIKITDFEKEVKYTYILTGCKCGKNHCYSYWFTKTGDCILNDDGTIDDDSLSFYNRNWEYVK